MRALRKLLTPICSARFDAGQEFASTGDGRLTVAGLKDGRWAVGQTVATAQGARKMGLDPITHQVFLPTAELEPAAAGTRPRPKPGTFKIVVVGRQ